LGESSYQKLATPVCEVNLQAGVLISGRYKKRMFAFAVGNDGGLIVDP
jgi:hypothetical protein